MKENVLKYILIVSLLMNVSFLGAAAYTHYKGPRYAANPFIDSRGVPVKPGHGTLGSCLFEELSLKPEQMKLFQEKAAVFHQTMGTKRQEVDRLRGSLIVLMRADNPDKEVIGGVIGKINAVQQEIQKLVVSHMLEFKSMLDKGQQEKFLDLVRNAMGQHGAAACP